MDGKHLVWIDHDYKAAFSDKGTCKIAVLRARGSDRIEGGYFHLDVWCLGVRDAFFFEVGRHELPTVQQQLFQDAPPVEKDGAWGRKLIEGAVEYAHQLGFAPCRDYRKAARIFSGIKTAECPESFVFGNEGKPFYVQSEYDTEEEADRIIARLRARCGEGNFHYLIVPPDAQWQEAEEAFEHAGEAIDTDYQGRIFAEQAGGGPICADLQKSIDEMRANLFEDSDAQVDYDPSEHALADQLQELVDGVLQKARFEGVEDLDALRYQILIHLFLVSAFKNSAVFDATKDNVLPGVSAEMIKEAFQEMEKSGLKEVLTPYFWEEDGFSRRLFHLDFSEESPPRLVLVCGEGYFPEF